MTLYVAIPPLETEDTEDETNPGEENPEIIPGETTIPTGLVWEDISTDTVEPRICFAAAIAWDGAIIIHGGYIYDDGWVPPEDLEGTASGTLMGTIIDGVITWEEIDSPSKVRAEAELIFIPQNEGSTKYGTLILMGGYILSGTYYDDPTTGEMAVKLSSSTGDWVAFGAKGGTATYLHMAAANPNWEASITYDLSWGPRSSFPLIRASDPYQGDGIIISGGRSENAALKVPWTGPDSALQDLWIQYTQGINPTGSPELVTAIDHDGTYESDDSGLGYRYSHVGCNYPGGNLVGGGTKRNSEGIWVWARDVFRFYDRLFISVNSDIMTGWPGATNYALVGLTHWKDRIVALISKKGFSAPDFLLFESFNQGANWRIAQKASMTIHSAVTGKYKISGDHTDSVESGDRITIKGTAAIAEYVVSSVALVGGYTEISLTGESGIPTVSSGTLYVNLIAGTLDMTDYDLANTLTVRMVSTGDELIVMGGKNDAGKFQVWRVKDNS